MYFHVSGMIMQYASRNLRVVTHLTIGLGLLWVLVEKTCVTDTSSYGGYIRRINVLSCQTLPGDFSKPWVLHDVFAAAVQVSQSLSKVVGDELGQEILSVWMDIWRELDSTTQNVLVDLQGTARIPERRETTQHLEYQDAKRPPKQY